MLRQKGFHEAKLRRLVAILQHHRDANDPLGAFQVQPVDLTEAQQVQLTHLFPGTRYLQSAQTLMVPAPRDANFEPLRDKPIIDWAWAFLARVFPPAAPN